MANTEFYYDKVNGSFHYEMPNGRPLKGKITIDTSGIAPKGKLVFELDSSHVDDFSDDTLKEVLEAMHMAIMIKVTAFRDQLEDATKKMYLEEGQLNLFSPPLPFTVSINDNGRKAPIDEREGLAVTLD